MQIFEELKARGMISQLTHETQIRELINGKPFKFYIGFDPTADSLHIGHFLTLSVMARMQQAGHTPIMLFGGGTGMIGDPSGKTDMRKMMTPEIINANVESFKRQASRFIDFSDNKAIMADNKDWLLNLNYMQFLREIGPHFSVNRMLSAECYKQRLETGLTFFELNYMVCQSYDFLVLAREHNCVMQLGGDDQWSNIIGGIELNRRIDRREVFGLTIPLLLTSDGRKMGKTESGAVWLDENKTSCYDFFQYWRNVDDKQVIEFMKKLTFMPLDEITNFEKLEGSQINTAKERLAFELTKIVHGENKANAALEAAKSVFSGTASADMPITKLQTKDLTNGTISLTDALAITNLAPSKAEARRLIQGGGISVDDEKISAIDYIITSDMLASGVIIKRGKKVHHKIEI